jgi:hypothetical protein
MSPTFQPPVAMDLPGTWGVRDPIQPVPKISHLLMRHFGGNPRGRTVLKISGTYATYDTPPQSLLDTATEIYQGGHIYTVSAAVATALTAAGYGDGLS